MTLLTRDIIENIAESVIKVTSRPTSDKLDANLWPYFNELFSINVKIASNKSSYF